MVPDGLCQDFNRARNNGKHVVEVMGDTARQLAYRLHLLCLDELLLGRALLGDIPNERIYDVTFAAAQLRKRHLGENLAAVAVQQRCFESPALRADTDVMQKLLDPLVVRVALQLRNDQVFRLRTNGFRSGPSEHRLGVRARRRRVRC